MTQGDEFKKVPEFAKKDAARKREAILHVNRKGVPVQEEKEHNDDSPSLKYAAKLPSK